MSVSVYRLKGRKVVDKEGVMVGKVEDMALNNFNVPWIIEALVVKTGTLKLTGRKIRVKTDYVSKVGNDFILLNTAIAELRKKEFKTS